MHFVDFFQRSLRRLETWVDIVSISFSSSNLFCFMYFLLRKRNLKGCLSDSNYTRKLVYWNFVMSLNSSKRSHSISVLAYWSTLETTVWHHMQKFILNIFHKITWSQCIYYCCLLFHDYVFKEERIYRFYTVGYGNYEIFFFFYKISLKSTNLSMNDNLLISRNIFLMSEIRVNSVFPQCEYTKKWCMWERASLQ